MKRLYRLFSDSYDVKEQWFYTLNQIMLHKEFIDQKKKNAETERIKDSSCRPSNSQDTHQS